MPKLLEFDYEIQFKKGKKNLAADALSRMEGAEILCASLSVIECDLLQRIKEAYNKDQEVQQIIADIKDKKELHQHYTYSHGILRRKSRLVIPKDKEIIMVVLQWMHDSLHGGYSGRDATQQRVKSLFYWKGMAKDIQVYVRACETCQRCKSDNAAYLGLLQPLPIPETIWTDISMDFINGLPPSFGKTTILVVVDRLTNAAHFLSLTHPYTALTVAQLYLDNIFKLHGFPRSIVSDRDSAFVIDFWDELFALNGVSLQMSTAYHPQSDGQTEVVNRCLETYLRYMCSEKPHMWSKWLALAEYWYNTTYHSSINKDDSI